MLVQFNGVWLTNDGSGAFPERAITSTCGSRLNGKEQVQDAQFMRAVAALPMDRGNLSHAFTFKVARNFQLLHSGAGNPIALASAFMMTHFTLLPKSGLLLLVCGGWGEAPILVKCQAAVLDGVPDHSYQGVSVETAYSLRCGPFSIVSTGSPLLNKNGAHLLNKDGTDLLNK